MDLSLVWTDEAAEKHYGRRNVTLNRNAKRMIPHAELYAQRSGRIWIPDVYIGSDIRKLRRLMNLTYICALIAMKI